MMTLRPATTTGSFKQRLLDEMTALSTVDCHSHTMLRRQYERLPGRSLFTIMAYFKRDVAGATGRPSADLYGGDADDAARWRRLRAVLDRARNVSYWRHNVVTYQWHINGEVTYPGAPAEGLLMNVRMVNAVFKNVVLEIANGGYVVVEIEHGLSAKTDPGEGSIASCAKAIGATVLAVAITGTKTFGREAQSFSHGWELPARLTGGAGEGISLDARFKPGTGGQLIAFVPSLDLVPVRITGSSGGEYAYEECLRLACAAMLPGPCVI